jgi:putative transposase
MAVMLCTPNAKCSGSGHFWQNRFFSCALDRSHLWAALRYVERNPVRVRMVEHASTYSWSSAGFHTGGISSPAWLQEEPIRSSFTAEQWDVYLKSDSVGEAELELRKRTYTGRPAGSREFVEWAESSLGRKLEAQTGGRPKKIGAVESVEQRSLFDGG